MTRRPIPAANPSQAGDDRSWARPLFEQQIALLDELAEAGMAVAVAIRDQVVAGDGDLLALAAAYDRVARAVRMAILLQSKLIKQLLDWDRQTDNMATQGLDAPQGRREADIQRAAAERDREHAEHIERLVGQGGERLEQDDIYKEVNSRPVSELIAMICRDIGLDPDWPRLAQEAWVQKETAGAGAGSPFAALAAQDIETAGAGPHRRPLGRPPDPH
jgi:hypothetical protein